MAFEPVDPEPERNIHAKNRIVYTDIHGTEALRSFAIAMNPRDLFDLFFFAKASIYVWNELSFIIEYPNANAIIFELKQDEKMMKIGRLLKLINHYSR